MEKASRIALISYCDKIGLGNRVLLGLKSPCEHRRLPDKLSRFILKTRSPMWIPPEEVSQREAEFPTENLMTEEDIDLEAPMPDEISKPPVFRSKLTWEARSINLLEAKYEPFVAFVANTNMTSPEITALLPSLYNYLVMQSVSKIILISSFDLRPGDSISGPLVIGEHHVDRIKALMSAHSAVSSTGNPDHLSLFEIPFNDCPSFGLPSINAANSLTCDPFLHVFSQLLTISRLPAIILGTFFESSSDDPLTDEYQLSKINDCAWRLATSLRNNTGIAFDYGTVESMDYEPPDDNSVKQNAAAVFM